MPADSRESEKRICKFPQPQAAKAGNLKPANPPKIESSSTTWRVQNRTSHSLHGVFDDQEFNPERHHADRLSAD
jgi:hypothetical protein